MSKSLIWRRKHEVNANKYNIIMGKRQGAFTRAGAFSRIVRFIKQRVKVNGYPLWFVAIFTKQKDFYDVRHLPKAMKLLQKWVCS